MPEVLVFVEVAPEQDDPASDTGLTIEATLRLDEAINAVPGLRVVLIRPTGPVMPVAPGGNHRLDFAAPLPPCGCKAECFEKANPQLPPQRECRRRASPTPG